MEHYVYVYAAPLTKKRVKDALGLSHEDQVSTLDLDDGGVTIAFSVPLRPQQEAALNQLLKPYGQRQKYKEGTPDPVAAPAPPAVGAPAKDGVVGTVLVD